MKTEIKHNLGPAYYQDGASPDNLTGYVSKSILWDCFKAQSPFKWRFGNRQKKITDQMAFGSLVHCLAFEPDNFRQQFAISEYENFRTKAAQEWKAEQEAKGIMIVDDADVKKASDMATIIHDEMGLRGFKDNQYEVAVYSDVAHKVKCMIDVVPDDAQTLIDLKTTTTIPDERGIVKLILDRGYHWQAAMYLDLYNAATGEDRDVFFFVFIETSAPHETAWVKISENMLDAGRTEYYEALSKWNECLKTGIWPKRINETLNAELPAWYAQKQ